MEGVASGMAVASLSIQLVESIVTIKGFLRHVKDAPKELERLIDLLGRLAAILQDVHNVLERQESWQGQYIPLPSNTIRSCVQGCEKTIQPLGELVQRYSALSVGNASWAKLKRDIKLAIKAKDIVEYETRVEREIGNLQAALATNMNSLLINSLPTLMQSREIMMTKTSIPIDHARTTSPFIPLSTDGSLASPSNIRSSRSVWEVQRVPPLLKYLGLSRRKVTRYYRPGFGDTSKQISGHQGEVMFEKEEVSVVWMRVGYSVSWSQSQSWGSILPSLRVTPIVRAFDSEVLYTIESGSVQELQQLFASGRIHPYTRDQWGRSILHEAARRHRPDMCQLLLQHGVKSNHDSYGMTALSRAIAFLNCITGAESDRIDTYRTLMSSEDVMDDVGDVSLVSSYGVSSSTWSPEPFHWLWKQLDSMSVDDEMETLRCKVFYMSLLGFGASQRYGGNIPVPNFDMSSRTRDAVNSGSKGFLTNVFFMSSASTSFVVGTAIIKALVKHGLDVEACLAPYVPIWNSTYHRPGRNVILEHTGEQGWTLGFTWIIDPRLAGHLLAQEFTALTVDSELGLPTRWPFDISGHYWTSKSEYPKRQSRFERRMSSKERKERARTGQKQPRSRMPGAWR